MRILIVDDHPIVASGCRTVFADDPEIILLEASDAESAERALVAEIPDFCGSAINIVTRSGYCLYTRGTLISIRRLLHLTV